jgi:hypothetical protein
MKTRTYALVLTVVLVTAVATFGAEDLNIGTWKLNEARSKIGAGAPKNITVNCMVVADSIKVTVDGMDAVGAATHNEWTGKFDGKDYPVIGDPTSDKRAYKRINDHTLSLTAKKGGQITMSGLIILSDDGKVRIVNVTGRNAKSEKIKSYTVYDKQ